MKRVLVFPCGSEIGLEIHRALHGVSHFTLVGGSSVPDHGRFVYDTLIGDLPFHTDPGFLAALKDVVTRYRIDAIYPTMDAVAETLKLVEAELGISVIGSSLRTTAIAASKTATHEVLRDHVPVPRHYPDSESVDCWPVFLKPDRGYGSRGAARADSYAEAAALISNAPAPLAVFEYLPGQEWTIDCFSDRHGKLRFQAARRRGRISNGISVNTTPCSEFADDFEAAALAINDVLHPRGAWFFQMKQDAMGQPRLLEVATRLGGSSALFRCRGINFAAMSLYDAFDMDVTLIDNGYPIELDRALSNRYRIGLEYSHVFVDLDDCLILQEGLNIGLLGFLFRAVGQGKEVTLITRHAHPVSDTLRRFRIADLFDRIVHITDRDVPKSAYIDRRDAIFIDDSFAERRNVQEVHGIAVFAPDMVEALT